MAEDAALLERLEIQASTEETLLQQAMRSAVMNVATGGMANAFAHPGLGDALSGTGTDVTGLNGAQIGDGSVMHNGPDIGGEALERPSAGYLAHTAGGGSVDVADGAGANVSSIARDLDNAGHLTMRGTTYDVFDYLPGGDAVQIAAGRVDPAQVMGSFAGEGIEHGMMFEAERGFKDVGSGRSGGVSDAAKSSGGMTADDGPVQGAHSHRGPRSAGIEGGPSGGYDGDVAEDLAGDSAGGTKRRIDPATGHHIPDADENARDMEELMFEHGQRLDTAVEASGQATVHTEVHAHGRTLAVDTYFEAVDRKDVPHEVKEAEDHAERTLHAVGAQETVETDTSDMRFRSQVHAYLDQQSRDEGMSL